MRPPPGLRIYAVGAYLEVEPARRLVFTLAWEGVPLDPGESRVTVEFHDRGGATEVVLTQEQIRNRASRAWHRWGWTGALRRLGRLAAETGSEPQPRRGA